MSSEPITRREYWEEVESIARDIFEETGSDEERDERLWETIDGHQWVIYTAYNYEVLGHSDNDGYSVEHFGADSVVKNGELDTAALAFGALYGDVSEKLWEMAQERESA